MINWLEIARTSMEYQAARKIGVDSDGNRYRISYAPGTAGLVAAHMERIAPECGGQEALISVFVKELERHEIPAFQGELQTS
jgi:hypothetical protein